MTSVSVAADNGEMRIALALACVLGLHAAEPPGDLLKRTLERETSTEGERGNYAYRQSVRIEELDTHGRRRGEYRELRDIVFSPDGKRFEKLVKPVYQTLDRLKLTDEDFRDIREVQPFLFTRDQLHLYETKYKGEEKIGDYQCWVMQVRPRQILQGQRLFDGLVWVNQGDYAVIQLEGKAVPEILNHKEENLFPRFTTVRRLVDGKFWLPEKTLGDDVLPFRTGPLRMRLTIEYSDYRRFGAESTIKFSQP